MDLSSGYERSLLLCTIPYPWRCQHTRRGVLGAGGRITHGSSDYPVLLPGTTKHASGKTVGSLWISSGGYLWRNRGIQRKIFGRIWTADWSMIANFNRKFSYTQWSSIIEAPQREGYFIIDNRIFKL